MKVDDIPTFMETLRDWMTTFPDMAESIARIAPVNIIARRDTCDGRRRARVSALLVEAILVPAASRRGLTAGVARILLASHERVT